MSIEKKALLIGIDSFKDSSLIKLPKVVSDLHCISSALLSPEGGAFISADTYGFTSEDITANSVCCKIEDFLSNVPRQGLALIYIASHAIVDQHGTLLILSQNFSKERPKSTSIPITFIASCLQLQPEQSVIIILDCCFADAGAYSLFANQQMPFELAGKKRPNFCVIASTRLDEPAIDGGFAPLFSKAIQEIDPADGEERTGIERIFDYIKTYLQKPFYQTPRMWLSVSTSIQLGRSYAGLRASKSALSNLYRTINSSTTIMNSDNGANLHFIEKVSHGYGLETRTGINVVEGEPTANDLENIVNKFRLTIENKTVDRGLIIVTDASKFTDLNSEHIKIVSFSDHRRNIIPYFLYLNKSIIEYEESDIHKLGCYINLRAHSEDGSQCFVLDQEILKWASDYNEYNQLTVLGDFGAGKTTTAKRVFWAQAKRHLERPTSERIPIYINLRDYNRSFDLETLIQRTLFEKGKSKGLTYEMASEFNDLGKVLWILDGFDEMATGVTSQIIKKNFSEILKLTKPKSRVLLTCRTHFFKNQEQVKETFTGTDLYDQLRETAQYRILFVDPLEQGDINRFIHIRLKNQADIFIDILKNSSQLNNLASRPILLEMIIKTLPKMVESDVTLNLPNLYEQYARIWFTREEWRGEIMTIEDRFRFCQRLAWHFFEEDIYTINYSEIPEFILTLFPQHAKTAKELEFLAQDVQTTAFLSRDAGGNYSFAHKSFLEFFVASYIFEYLLSGKPDILEKKILPYEILRFLGDKIQENGEAKQQLSFLSKTGKFDFKYFFLRFLSTRMLPVIFWDKRKHPPTQKIGAFHSIAAVYLGSTIVGIGILSFIMLKVERSLNILLFEGLLLLSISLIIITIILYFVYYVYLTTKGDAGEPNIKFNLLAINHFSGISIDTNLVSKIINDLKQEQKSVAALTHKAILGIPIEEAPIAVVEEKNNKAIPKNLGKPNKIAMCGMIIGFICSWCLSWVISNQDFSIGFNDFLFNVAWLHLMASLVISLFWLQLYQTYTKKWQESTENILQRLTNWLSARWLRIVFILIVIVTWGLILHVQSIRKTNIIDFAQRIDVSKNVISSLTGKINNEYFKLLALKFNARDAEFRQEIASFPSFNNLRTKFDDKDTAKPYQISVVELCEIIEEPLGFKVRNFISNNEVVRTNSQETPLFVTAEDMVKNITSFESSTPYIETQWFLRSNRDFYENRNEIFYEHGDFYENRDRIFIEELTEYNLRLTDIIAKYFLPIIDKSDVKIDYNNYSSLLKAFNSEVKRVAQLEKIEAMYFKIILAIFLVWLTLCTLDMLKSIVSWTALTSIFIGGSTGIGIVSLNQIIIGQLNDNDQIGIIFKCLSILFGSFAMMVFLSWLIKRKEQTEKS